MNQGEELIRAGVGGPQVAEMLVLLIPQSLAVTIPMALLRATCPVRYDVSTAMANPVLVTDTLFGLSERGRGSSSHSMRIPGRRCGWDRRVRRRTPAIVKAEGLLFLLNDDAELIVARASRAGFEPIARYTVADSATWTQPAISGNRFFVKDVDTLALLDDDVTCSLTRRNGRPSADATTSDALINLVHEETRETYEMKSPARARIQVAMRLRIADSDHGPSHYLHVPLLDTSVRLSLKGSQPD